jgi:oxygen-dependent protoporphyrinogen oxidase
VNRAARIVIIGGGITGLAAAFTLATRASGRGRPIACTLVERAPALGGKVRTEQVRGCVVETGPDSFLASKPAAADLCRALGLGDRLIGTLPGRAIYVAAGGRLHPLPPGLAMGVPTRLLPVLCTRLLSPVAKARLACDLVLPRRRPAGDETVGALIGRRLGRAAVDRLVGPLLGGIYAGDADALSARATVPQLLQWEADHRSLILAAIRVRRRSMAAAGGSPMFLGLAGGLGAMIDALQGALAAAATVIVGQPAVGIRREGAAYAVRLAGGRTLEADAVLLATPAFAAADLLEPLDPPLGALLRAIPYASTATVTLAYRRAEIGHPLDGHGFVVAHSEPRQITACTWVSSKWPDRAPPDLTLLRCYLGSAGRDGIVAEDDAHLLGAARADLAHLMGIAAPPVFAHIARWPRAMPQYAPGHLERLETIEGRLRSLPGIAIAGAGYRGVGIPDCIRQGAEAAARLADGLDAARPEAAIR